MADEGHLTRAAERLHLSQPALSAHIKALEDELGVALFERTPSGMLLTRAGRQLVEHAERVLLAAAELRHAARAFRGEISGHVRVGTVSDPKLLKLGEFLGRLVERHPGLEIELRQTVSGAALEAVRRGELDASFYFGEIEHPDLAGIALGEIAYRVAAPVAWSEKVCAAQWEGVAALPWIVTPEISSHRRLLRSLLEEHRVAPASVVEADNEAVIANLVASGVGVSLLREDLALDMERRGDIAIWPHARPTAKLWFLHRNDRAEDPMIAALTQALAVSR